MLEIGKKAKVSMRGFTEHGLEYFNINNVYYLVNHFNHIKIYLYSTIIKVEDSEVYEIPECLVWSATYIPKADRFYNEAWDTFLDSEVAGVVVLKNIARSNPFGCESE